MREYCVSKLCVTLRNSFVIELEFTSALACAHFKIEIVEHLQINIEFSQTVFLAAVAAPNALVTQARQAIMSTKPALSAMYVHRISAHESL